MTDYVLNKKPEPASNDMVWAFDLGKGSIGEAVRRGNEFLHKASLPWRADSSRHSAVTAEVKRRRLIPAEFEKDKTGKVALVGFVLETLFNAACPHGEQRHGLRYLTLS